MEEKSEEYFALKKGGDLSKALNTKVDEYYAYLKATELYETILASYKLYYGFSKDNKFCAHKIQKSKDKPFAVKVPHFRNVAQHVINIVNKNKTNFEAIAQNNDSDSLAQTGLAKNLVNHYFSGEKGVNPECQAALEYAVILGSADVAAEWNKWGGRFYAQSEDGVVSQGDIETTCLSPFDAIREPGIKPSKQNWVIIRTKENKWELSSRYPSHKESILKSGSNDKSMRLSYNGNDDTKKSSDYIYVYKLYHKKTNLMRQGREVFFLNDKIIHDKPLSYEDIPVHNLQAHTILDSGLGYGHVFDIMGLSEVYDKLTSVVYNNQIVFGRPYLKASKSGAPPTISWVGGIPIILTQDDQKLESLDLKGTPAEVFKSLAETEKNIEKIAGLSSAVRGDPASNLKSGNALALVASQSYQFVSTLDQNHKSLLENVATGIIRLLKQFATTDRIENIGGKKNQIAVTSFKGDNLSRVVGVKLQVGSPLMRTLAGRVEVADNLLTKGLIKNLDDYFMVLDTGRTEFIYDSEQSATILLETENEQLSEGINPPVSINDQHHAHIREHLSVLHKPHSRDKPELVQAVNEHIQEHLNLWKNSDPNILAILGVPPYVQNQPMQPPIPAQPPAPGGPMGNPMASDPAGNVRQINDVEKLKQKMPTNPLTGQQFNPEIPQ